MITIQQISLFLENKPGNLCKITKILNAEKLNIRAMSLGETLDFGVLRLILPEPDRAKKILREKGFTVGSSFVFGIEIQDSPGALHFALSFLSEHNINIEYLYVFIHSDNKAILILRPDKINQAFTLLEQAKFKFLTQKDIDSL